MDILSNELADALVKESTLESLKSEEVSLIYLKSKLRSLSLEAWEKSLEKSIQSKDLSLTSYKATYSLRLKTSVNLPKVERVVASAFYQLKIGHGYYKDYLYRIKRSNTNLCSCGKVETPRHLLLGCPELSSTRARLRDSLGTSRLTLPLLLETKKGVEGTLGFLKSIGILTRKWYT